MSHVMVDTSAWIEYFRGRNRSASDILDSLLEQDRVALCGVVETELLRGVRLCEQKRLKGMLNALHFVETTRENFAAAGERLCKLRENGVAIPVTDALIAAVCAHNGLELLTQDTHFAHFKEVKQIKNS